MLKRFLKYCVLFSAIGSLVVFAGYSVYKNEVSHSIENIQKPTNVSDGYSWAFQNTIKKSRQSAVQVISTTKNDGMLSSASGTYFETQGRYFVITVDHGILGDCPYTSVAHEGVFYDCQRYIAMDPIRDYVVMEVEKIETRVPIKIPQDLPPPQQWKDSYSILNNVLYTGYPNSIGPLTIHGKVAGWAGSEYVYIYSYAWAGSSGSGVFDRKGRYIGYIIAIDVGQTEFGINVLENIILIGPANKIDWPFILNQIGKNDD